MSEAGIAVSSRRIPLWQRWTVVLAVSVVMAGGGTWAFLHFYLWNRLPAALVGKWEVVEPPSMRGGTFEFFRSGTLEVYHADSGSLLRAHAVLTGKTLSTTTRQETSGHQDTKHSTIRELTDTTLVLELVRHGSFDGVQARKARHH
jgi:hypothetical protein